MNKRKLRRVAIVALVLVLLCNTLGVQASTKKDDPTVIVKDYGSLYTAIAEAIDNWEMDMSKELLDELKDLEKKCRSVNQRMKKDIARNS